MKELQKKLQQLYGEREAAAMIRILLEDGPGLFGLKADEFPGSEAFGETEKRLAGGEPLQYVLGQADFYGMKFRVNSAVLIPRQETEELVFRVLEKNKKAPSPRILDVGTGSGCIAISLKKKIPQSEVWAIDISREALEVARENARRHEVEIRFFELDFLLPASWKKLPDFDMIVSNPPYIPIYQKDRVGENVLRFEPETALFVTDSDPLLFYKTILKFASTALKDGGEVYLEINEFLGEGTRQLFLEAGYKNVRIVRDISGKDRILEARKNEPPMPEDFF